MVEESPAPLRLRPTAQGGQKGAWVTGHHRKAVLDSHTFVQAPSATGRVGSLQAAGQWPEVTMWRQLFPLALCVATAVWAQTQLPDLQHRGLQVALEEFHKHPPVQWAFHETEVFNASHVTLTNGTFVRLEFKLQQTNCRKKDWKSTDCKVKPNGRKRICLACIKLDFEGKVMSRIVHCPVQTQVKQENKERVKEQCNKVEQVGEDPQSFNYPGVLGFSKARL